MLLYVSAVGLDRNGVAVTHELDARGLPYHLERVPYPTGTVIADISDPNNPKYNIKTRVAWNHIPFTEELREIASRTKAVCFGTLAQWGRESRRCIRLFLNSCPEDCIKICDINLRQHYFNKSIRESLRRVVILTKGTDGSYVLSREGKSILGTPKVKVASAVGAGDSFTGAFIGSILNGRSIVEAHRSAVKVSAYVCTQKGSMPEIPKDLLAEENKNGSPAI